MQLSHFLKVYRWEEKPGHLLLYSTKKASKTLLKKETYEAIEKGALSPSDEALLSKLGVIVQDREEEKRSVLGFFDEFNRKNAGLDIVVVLNLDCNFSCIYCYEGGMKGKRYLSDTTRDRLIGFIKEKFTEDKRFLHIDFYGGEPLLSVELIKSISRSLNAFTEHRGASYSFSLVTNGSLLKKRVAAELVQLGLRNVKVTLDGPSEIHDRSRPFRSGAGSFDAIIRNIKETCDLVKIGIGGNFERDNYRRFPMLLDYLIREGLTPDKIATVKFDPVMKHPKGDLSPPDYGGGCMSVNEPWLVDATALLREEILKRGYNTLKLTPAFCMLESTDSYVVNFDGGIYKCPAFIGKRGFEVGSLETGVRNYTASHKLGLWKNQDCAECDYLPLCFGGCRYMTFVRDGNIDTLDCQRAYFDASLETLIRQDIKYALKADGR